MFIQCKKALSGNRLEFKKDMKCPITNISENGITYYFDYPNGHSDFISTSYLEELSEFLEVKEETLCNHPEHKRETIWNRIICSECQELISALPKEKS